MLPKTIKRKKMIRMEMIKKKMQIEKDELDLKKN